MGHSYYSYTKEELVGNGPKLPVIVMEDNAEVFHSMAVEMVDEITAANGGATVDIRLPLVRHKEGMHGNHSGR